MGLRVNLHFASSSIAFKGIVEATLANLACSTNIPRKALASNITLSVYQYWRKDLPPDALNKPISS
ncbi:hypothetical protein GGS23DRAFT_598399 [Durotheca rogersii]|uniref:uncharacterized protein n=1 Tax=Durotheca rogersii TaxID=419775 RepID=UPI00221FA2E4|nr:uncharacterized protein GGS23DRAFT_598399 [Durotheca rogersii]KAI5861622.1 hypothetical protein GGS23DRAFT_598399 [Durotheca rogersii]